MSKNFAKLQVSSAVRTRNGPDTLDIHTAPLNSNVLVYRPEVDKSDGAWSLLDIQGETCTVLLPPPSGPTKLRTTVVKRFIKDDDASPVARNKEPRSPPLPAFNHASTDKDPVTQALTLTVQ